MFKSLETLFFMGFLLTPLYSVPAFSRPPRVFIDPGHGGEDCGAHTRYKGRSLCEKELTLKIALEAAKSMREKGFDVGLTRSKDNTLALEERAQLADKENADIFISIHANSHGSSLGRGIETYYLDNHNDKAVRRLEREENATSQLEDEQIKSILADLVVERTAPRSKRLAKKVHTLIHKSATDEYHLPDRGIKPALFYVLALTKRPSILIEAGFMSNPTDLKNLLRRDYQKRIGGAIAKGVEDYFAMTKIVAKKDKKKIKESVEKNLNKDGQEELPLF